MTKFRKTIRVPAPAPAPAPAPQSSGLKSMMAQGMAIGAGSAVGHMAVGGIANALSGSTHQPQSSIQQYDNYLYQFNKCMKDHDNDFVLCENFYKMYTSNSN